MLTSGKGLFSSSAKAAETDADGSVVAADAQRTDANNVNSDASSNSLPMEPEAEYQPARSSWLFPPSIVGRPPSPPPPREEDHGEHEPSSKDEHPPVRIIDTSDWGMVSSNGSGVVIEDDDAAAFAANNNNDDANIVAGNLNNPDHILAATYGSFQHVLLQRGLNDPTGASETRHHHSVPNGRGGGGVLILDGISHTGSTGGGGEDPSTLSIPGSESMPSDPGTIHQSDEDDLLEEYEDDDKDHTSDANWELDHLGSNIRHYARRLLASNRPHSNNNNNNGRRHHRRGHGGHGGRSNRHRPSTTSVHRRGLWSTVAVALLVVGGGAGVYHLQQRQLAQKRVLQQALMEMQLQNQRLLEEEEALRVKLQAVQEEARAAAAAALAAELEAEELRTSTASSSNGYRHPHKKQKTTAGNGGHDFDWSKVDDCDADASSFTVMDNCWVKAKANVQMGDCGDGTLEYFKDLWNGLWENIDASFSSLTDQHWALLYDDEMQMPHDSTDDENDEDPYKTYHDYQEEYIPQHDPLGHLMEAIQSAGQTVGAKFAQLMKDEATRVEDIEPVIHDGISQTSDALKEAMNKAKQDVHYLSQEALTALNAAFSVKGHHRHQDGYDEGGTKQDVEDKQSPPQAVTRKGLFDAVSALSALTKTWQETATTATLSTTIKSHSEVP